MNEQIAIVLTIATVFTGIYMIIKSFTDFLLRRKLINSGHVEKVSILEPVQSNPEEKKHNTLKWGLVAAFAGARLIVIELMSNAGGLVWVHGEGSFRPFDSGLMFIAAGLLNISFMVTRKR